MRIVSGTLKGRVFQAPAGSTTHPMSEKARGGLFNVLGDLQGLSILDAFSGSGAISFEAISRGARHATAIEQSKPAVTAIEESIRTFHLESRVALIRAAVGAWLQTSTDRYDIVIADPPYTHSYESLLQALSERVVVGGLFIVSLPPVSELTLPPESFRLRKQKQYGDATIWFFERTGAAPSRVG